MSYFNEDNVTEQICIDMAKQLGYKYVDSDTLRKQEIRLCPTTISSDQRQQLY